jgi:hypothetical protein
VTSPPLARISVISRSSKELSSGTVSLLACRCGYNDATGEQTLL